MSTVAPEISAPALRPYRFSVNQYDQLARLGVLTKTDRVELIDGILVEKMTKNERHLTTTWLIHAALTRNLPGGWFAVTESPIVLDRSEPEPDVLVIRGRIPDYFQRKPTPGDLGLIVEVSDSSYGEDRARCAMYGAAGIVCYWIANIRERRVEVYTMPTGPADQPGYQSRQDYGWDAEVPLLISGNVPLSFRVRDLIASVD